VEGGFYHSSIRGMTANDKELFVALHTFDVHVFQLTGTFLHKFSTDKSVLQGDCMLALRGNGDLLVVNSKKVQLFKTSGVRIASVLKVGKHHPNLCCAAAFDDSFVVANIKQKYDSKTEKTTYSGGVSVFQ
jgi:hypothetical protein